MTTISIDAASAAQLLSFASTHLGLAGLTPRMSKEAILEAMRAVGHEADTIELVEEEKKQPRKRGPNADPNDRKVRIHVAAEPGEGGNRPIPVAVNGIAMLIPRGKDVEVPWKYLHALQNAKAAQAEVDEDGQIVSWREAPAYPVSVLSQ